jgi:hypothetical protein
VCVPEGSVPGSTKDRMYDQLQLYGNLYTPSISAGSGA